VPAKLKTRHLNFMENHWIILSLTGLALLWASSLIAMRQWTRRQVLKNLLVGESGVEIKLPPDPRPEDQAALEIIKSYRDGYLWNRWPETTLSFIAINDLFLEIIKEIAGVYYPEEDRPELRASLADLVAFHNRVGSRLATWLETAPIRPFKDVELSTIIRYYDLYQNLRNHPVSQFIRRHRLHKAASWSWAAFNYNSPFYWGRRAAYEVGRRLLLARLADLVGEEAMLLYGRRV
jgi:hypothetical protein